MRLPFRKTKSLSVVSRGNPELAAVAAIQMSFLGRREKTDNGVR